MGTDGQLSPQERTEKNYGFMNDRQSNLVIWLGRDDNDIEHDSLCKFEPNGSNATPANDLD